MDTPTHWAPMEYREFVRLFVPYRQRIDGFDATRGTVDRFIDEWRNAHFATFPIPVHFDDSNGQICPQVRHAIDDFADVAFLAAGPPNDCCVDRRDFGPVARALQTEIELQRGNGLFGQNNGLTVSNRDPLVPANWNPIQNRIEVFDAETTFHELGHWLEARNTRVGDAARHFLRWRVAGRKDPFRFYLTDGALRVAFDPGDDVDAYPYLYIPAHQTFVGSPQAQTEEIAAYIAHPTGGLNALESTEVSSSAFQALLDGERFLSYLRRDPALIAFLWAVVDGAFGFASPFDLPCAETSDYAESLRRLRQASNKLVRAQDLARRAKGNN